MDAFENVPLNAVRARAICRDLRLSEALATEDGSGLITGERWFGNTPYGGQAPDNAMIGLLASLRADQAQIAGFQVCPVVSLVRLPDEYARIASRFFWYRRYEGAYWQEIRLMPSNVRVFFHSALTFGVDTSRVFTLFGLETFEGAERFLTNLARSSFAALTLYARTLRHDAASGMYRPRLPRCLARQRRGRCRGRHDALRGPGGNRRRRCRETGRREGDYRAAIPSPRVRGLLCARGPRRRGRASLEGIPWAFGPPALDLGGPPERLRRRSVPFDRAERGQARPPH